MTTGWVRAGSALGAVLTAAVGLAGCSSSQTPEVQQVATRFVEAAAGDPAAACDLLAPGTRSAVEEEGPCAGELGEAGLPSSATVTRVDIAGHSARAVLEGQTVFLALFDRGWRVTAAGCRSDSADPASAYDCTVKGE